jgi:polyhydroxybutyrate depolymerase
MKKRATFIIAVIVALTTHLYCVKNIEAYNDQKSGDFYESTIVDGLKRTYLLHVPTGYNKSKSYPLVFCLHGSAGNSKTQSERTKFSQLADKEGFFIVYPEAENKARQWNAGFELNNKVDDVNFIRTLIGQFSAKYNIDQNAVYCSGLSSGAMMAYRLGVELSDKISAIASVAGTLTKIASTSYPSFSIPLLIIHGTKDTRVPWESKTNDSKSLIFSVQETLRRWQIFNNATTIPQITKLGDKDKKDDCTVDKKVYSSISNSSKITVFKVNGGGHGWPGIKPEGESGNITNDINATEEIWKFFKAHKRLGESPISRIDINGKQREFYLHKPNSIEKSKKYPCVITIHGGGGTAKAMLIESDLLAFADKKTFILALPEGNRSNPGKPGNFATNPQTWNDGSGRFSVDCDDVGFFSMLIDELISKHNADPKRIFVTGFSNGASMTLRLGVELSTKITAIAPISGHLWNMDWVQEKPVPMCYIIGANDPLNPINGGNVKTPSGITEYHPPVAKTIEKWVSNLSCKNEPKTTFDNIGVKCQTYSDCKESTQIEYWTVEGLGHVWPGAVVSLLPETMVGKASGKLSANETLWAFFSKHKQK